MNILVTGGAGYIGSHTAVELIEAGYLPIIVDNLINSNRESVRRVEQITGTSIPFYEIDLRDRAALDTVFSNHSIDAVIHFAGLKAVGESVDKPLHYYQNNLDSTLSLLETMQKHGVKNLVFSSSATVYGTPSELPLKETSVVGDGITNPYGQTKFMIEQILQDISKADPSFSITILRYFNPVGAHESGLIGEDPNGPPNNLLPYVSQVAVGARTQVQVFGNDYDTPDGTGVRDYIHVVDLAKGHLAALTRSSPGVSTHNLGSGTGVSVLELITAFSKAIGKDIPFVIAPRRAGDVASSYADPSKAKAELNWQTQKSLQDICKDTWRWQSQNPSGYTGSDG